jgi:hypothetical protein
MKVDLEKLEVDIDLHLPRWAMNPAAKLGNGMGVVSGLQSSTRQYVHQPKPLILASYGCSIIPQGKGRRTKPCVKCARKAA